MLFSSNGKKFHINIYGGSHEPVIGVVIHGLPEEFSWSLDDLTPYLKRRLGGNSPYVTSRKEPDIPYIKSRNPLTIEIKNTDVDSSTYNLDIPRPSHADYTGWIKYGNSINLRGGGPFSGRMTVLIVIAGALAEEYLKTLGVTFTSHLLSLGSVNDISLLDINFSDHSNLADISNQYIPMFSSSSRKAAGDLLDGVIATKDSIGGIAEVEITGVPPAIGGPLFDGLEGSFAYDLYAIPGVKGVEFGSGFESTKWWGSKNNDSFFIDNNIIKTSTNNHGGILGGISSGMPIVARVAFKPTPSIGKAQDSVCLSSLTPVSLTISGRHDPCIAIRGVVVAECMMAITLLDSYLVHTDNPEADNLAALRGQIDNIDLELLSLLEKRLQLCSDIGKYKKAHGIEVVSLERQKSLIQKLKSCYPKLDPMLIDSLYESIFNYSIGLQQKTKE